MSEPIAEDKYKGMKKDQLIAALHEAQASISMASSVRTIARTRRKWAAKGDGAVIHTVVISATEQELLDCAEFITDLADVAPMPLRRFASGARIMFEQDDEEGD